MNFDTEDQYRMAEDLGRQPQLPSNSSEQPRYTVSDIGFLDGLAFGVLIPPTIYFYHMAKARLNRRLDVPHVYRHNYHLRRPPICVASVSSFCAMDEEDRLTFLQQIRIPWGWIRRAGGRFQVGTSLIAPGRWLSPLNSMLLRDARELRPRDPVRSTAGVTQGQKTKKRLDMRPLTQWLHDIDSEADNAPLKRINFEESMGAYWYRETLQGTVRTLRSPSGPFLRISQPVESCKASSSTVAPACP